MSETNVFVPKIIYLDRRILEEKTDEFIAVIDSQRGAKNKNLVLAKRFAESAAGMESVVDEILNPLRRPRADGIASILTGQNDRFRGMTMGDLAATDPEGKDIAERYVRATRQIYIDKEIIKRNQYGRDSKAAQVHSDINEALNNYIEASVIFYGLKCSPSIAVQAIDNFITFIKGHIVGNLGVTYIGADNVTKVEFGKLRPS